MDNLASCIYLPDFGFKLKYNTLIDRDRDISKDVIQLFFLNPLFVYLYYLDLRGIAISPALNENILSDKILSLLFPNFTIFAGLI
jgi:hypothetical protein